MLREGASTEEGTPPAVMPKYGAALQLRIGSERPLQSGEGGIGDSERR